ncbi:ELM1/GtrOC1 family putative glycosyltransferase [Campylobacter suis]|uniref:Mitochondrial fission ELM1 family protein n=1 Tax=Campylobacter suis TaxID=2790657 RepID=A0ABN7K2R8_9BACT|nr:ELM1/GtrOC1 family putative glycosyltransferase [Campylobacter suis]CAD7286831.1 hypothetical protein LMG8286_00559 [Campylobacter suis]
MKKVLVISDKRSGHESQSIAFCKLMGYEYTVLEIEFACKFLKFLSYLLDFLKIYLPIFSKKKMSLTGFDIVISCGSGTYYANKFYAKKLEIKNIALMLPKGFRNDFSLVFNTFHDKSGEENVINLPVNLNFIDNKIYYTPKGKAIGFLIGGDNKIFKMDADIIRVIKELKSRFSDYEIMLTTSNRTPKNIVKELEKEGFKYFIDPCKNPINPIGNFMQSCEFVFITQDSVSMVSEAVCTPGASVVILELSNNKDSKFDLFINNLKRLGLVQIYTKNCELKITKKLNLKEILQEIKL